MCASDTPLAIFWIVLLCYNKYIFYESFYKLVYCIISHLHPESGSTLEQQTTGSNPCHRPTDGSYDKSLESIPNPTSPLDVSWLSDLFRAPGLAFAVFDWERACRQSAHAQWVTRVLSAWWASCTALSGSSPSGSLPVTLCQTPSPH